MTVQDIISELETVAPLAYQESYDNAGLLVGNRTDAVEKVLITLDVTESVVREAIECGANLIISHHPLIFRPLKSINSATETGRCIMLALQNNIAIYACHTNIDSVSNGVNAMICDKIGLQNKKILSPRANCLTKLISYVPKQHAETVLEALFSAGAGCIGNYDKCSFSSDGVGTFRANENAHPFVGEKNELHHENETRIEVVFPNEKTNAVVANLLQNHPYEEVAYDLFPIKNTFSLVGDGMIGDLPTPEKTTEFLKRIKDTFGCGVIRHTNITKESISRIAVCGGSGSFLIHDAIRSKADVFITADVKYHDFFNAENKIILADIGHYESEQFTKELFYELLKKKFYNFAIQISKVNTNPINYI